MKNSRTKEDVSLDDREVIRVVCNFVSLAELFGRSLTSATGFPCRRHNLRHIFSGKESSPRRKTALLLIDYVSIEADDRLAAVADIVARFHRPPYILFHVPHAVRGEDAMSLVLQGCRGIVFRNAPSTLMFKAVDAVIQGELWFPRRVLDMALSSVAVERPPRSGIVQSCVKNSLRGLTRREREILTLAAAGRSNFEMATHLGISGNTVKTHLASLYRKLNVSSRVEVILWFSRHRQELLSAQDLFLRL